MTLQNNIYMGRFDSTNNVGTLLYSGLKENVASAIIGHGDIESFNCG